MARRVSARVMVRRVSARVMVRRVCGGESEG